MQHCKINNKFTVSLLLGLLASVSVSVVAETSARQRLSQHSLLLAGGSTNPWALPQPSKKTQNFQHSPSYQNYRYQGNQSGTQYPSFNFVTPEILESIKQQQIQVQMQPQQMPHDSSIRQYRSPQRMPAQVMPGQIMPNQTMPDQTMPGYYEFPSNASGFNHPLYDSPIVSPWGNGSEMMNQNESFPWVPNAAIGGIPPMNVSPYIGNNGMNNGLGEEKFVREKNQNQVFNPFTFGSNGNL